MDARTFENARWESGDQKMQFRHHACLDLIKEGTVLDVGCGDGLLLKLLTDRGVTAEGVDFSPEAVRKCEAKGIKATLHDTNNPLPFPDNMFDYVLAIDVLEHQYHPLPLLKEMTRVSRKHVIVGVPNFSSLPARLQVILGHVPENNRPNKGHIYWFNHLVLMNLAAKAGLTLVECRKNTFRPASFFGSMLPALSPNLFSLSFVALFKK